MEGHRRNAVLGGIRSKLLMTRNNLTTDGSEFVLPDGRPYSGPYHVHIREGAMEGERHVKTSHRPLKPVNEVIARKVGIIQKGMRNESSGSTAQPVSPTPTRQVSSRSNYRRPSRPASNTSTGSGY